MKRPVNLSNQTGHIFFNNHKVGTHNTQHSTTQHSQTEIYNRCCIFSVKHCHRHTEQAKLREIFILKSVLFDITHHSLYFKCEMDHQINTLLKRQKSTSPSNIYCFQSVQNMIDNAAKIKKNYQLKTQAALSSLYFCQIYLFSKSQEIPEHISGKPA